MKSRAWWLRHRWRMAWMLHHTECVVRLAVKIQRSDPAVRSQRPAGEQAIRDAAAQMRRSGHPPRSREGEYQWTCPACGTIQLAKVGDASGCWNCRCRAATAGPNAPA